MDLPRDPLSDDVTVAAAEASAEPRSGAPWSPRDILRGSFAALGMLIAGAVLVVVIALVAGVAGLDVTDPLLLRILTFALMGLEAVFVLPAWLWGPRRYGLPFGALGLRGTRFGRALLLAAAGMAVIIATDAAWAVVTERYHLSVQPDLVPLFGEGLGGLLGALAVAGVVAPIAEELFFRGFMFAGLRSRWGLWPAVLVSSVVFALFHMSFSTLVPIAVMGAVFALLYERTRSLWPAIALHALNNIIAVIGAYLATSLSL